MENCATPAIVTKDLAMLVYGRDGRLGPRLKHLFQGTFRNPEANRLTGIYEVVMKKASLGSPGNCKKKNLKKNGEKKRKIMHLIHLKCECLFIQLSGYSLQKFCLVLTCSSIFHRKDGTFRFTVWKFQKFFCLSDFA